MRNCLLLFSTLKNSLQHGSQQIVDVKENTNEQIAFKGCLYQQNVSSKINLKHMQGKIKIWSHYIQRENITDSQISTTSQGEDPYDSMNIFSQSGKHVQMFGCLIEASFCPWKKCFHADGSGNRISAFLKDKQ